MGDLDEFIDVPIPHELLSALLNINIAKKVYKNLPGKPYNGPIMFLPGHEELAVLQLYTIAHLTSEGVGVNREVNFYTLRIGKGAKINLKKGKTEKSNYFYLANNVYEPIRQLVIPTHEFLKYLETVE
ncbi:MAG: hypothetical protein AABW92_02170 [Nanoarchaeota archaeon]